MFINKKSASIVLATAMMLSSVVFTSMPALADTVETAKNDTNQELVQSDQKSVDDAQENEAPAQSTPEKTEVQATSSMDTQAVASSMLSELNNLRSQNGLEAMSNIAFLNGYSQSRANTIASQQSANHDGYDSNAMSPYDQNAAECVGSAYLGALPDDPASVGKWFIKNFYTEEYAPEGNYGHRKALLQPYTRYVGIGVAVSNGNMYVAVDFGNDSAAQSTINQSDNSKYQLSYMNMYANNSKYDAVNTNFPDHTNHDGFVAVDFRGGGHNNGWIYCNV